MQFAIGEREAKADRALHYFTARNGRILGFAGLWDRWKEEEGKEVISCSIIVREADDWTLKYHARIAAMLHPEDFDSWSSGEGGKELFEKPACAMHEWIVTKRVNRSGEGGPSTIEAVVQGVEPRS